MYAVMAIAAAMFSLRHACLFFFLAAVALLAWLEYNNVRSSTVPLPFVWKLGVQFDAVRLCKLGAAFFGAASLYVYRARVPLHWPLAVVSLLVCAALPSSAVQQVCLAFAVPYATVSLAVTPPKHLAGAIANDLSYGVYIYAYPVQQYISALSKAENLGWSAAFIASSSVTLLLAWLSWHLVEKPALSHKPRAPKRAEARVV
jgi:peptidoglycan/LPS O-acetylase OafA/YrhL